MHRTLDAFSLRCPSMPTSGMMRWRLYRLISSCESSGCTSVAVGAPPATDGTMLNESPGFTGVCSFCR